MGDGPPALVLSFDLMLEELLAAAFIVSCSVVVAASPGSAESTTVVAVSSHQPSAQELVQLMPPRVGQTDVEIGNDTPTQREAAQRLTWFLDEVRVVREPPLVSSSTRQRARSRSPLPIGSVPNRWHTYRPPDKVRYSSCNGWGSRRRPLRFHLRQRDYSTPCVPKLCLWAMWRPLTCCFPHSTGVHGSSSGKTGRTRMCSHNGCPILQYRIRVQSARLVQLLDHLARYMRVVYIANSFLLNSNDTYSRKKSFS